MITVYKCIRGSRATGLNLPGSDHDYFKVVIPPTEAIIGLGNMRGSQKIDPVTGDDCRVITLKELIRQAIAGKSVEVEWLFVGDHCVLEMHPVYGRELMDIKDAMISSRMFKGLLGFATGNRTQAINGNKDRFRADIGYDPKALSHALRAIWQAVRLKQTGKLPISPIGGSKEAILAVKKGEMLLDHAMSLFDAWDGAFNSTPDSPNLPANPDVERLERWLMGVHLRAIVENSQKS